MSKISLPNFELDASVTFPNASDILAYCEDFPIVAGSKRYEPKALNVIASFDIEATSFFHDPKTNKCYSVDEYKHLSDRIKPRLQKRATMYAWGFGLNGKVVFGRTWEEFESMLSVLKKRYGLGKDLVLKIFIQNESYEFQFMKDRFEWRSVFATSDRYPIRALTKDGIEFCDSLIISGMSLENMGESLRKYSVRKMVGDLDYKKLRHSRTYLSDDELYYLKCDNLVLMAYMQELLEDKKSINRIPMTKTGFVRKDVRDWCFWEGRGHHRDKDHRWEKYSRLMASLTMEVEEYKLAKRCFMGGFTHASYLNSGIVLEDVTSMDLASSYPSVICSEMFPMSKGIRVHPASLEELKKYLKEYCCILEVEIWGLESNFPYEHILSRSKCSELEGAEEDNGRLIKASHLVTCWTDVDWECMEKFYDWKRFSIREMWIYDPGYLPKAIIEKTLMYYRDKTELKGVAGCEAFYDRAKTMVNSIFGMMVMDPIQGKITYSEGQWSNELEDAKKDPISFNDYLKGELEKYNKSKDRFTSYLWGLFITAYARRNILASIRYGVKEDYIYTDTDSVKFLHAEKHQAYFDSYNRFISAKIASCMRYYGLREDLAEPLTKDGIRKPLGVFELDGVYKRFATKGAKRYFVDYGKPKKESEPWSRYNLTISGVSKRKAIPWIYNWMQRTGKDFFDFFTWGRVFDADASGKLTHIYIDEPFEGEMVDYQGNKARYSEKSAVHLEESTYRLGASDEYISLLDSLERVNNIVYID